MKSKFLPFAIISVLLGFLVLSRTIFETKTTPSASPAPVLGETNNINSIEIDGFQISWFEVNDKQIKLIPNFSKKLNTSDIFAENACEYATNAGFYSRVTSDVAYKPIGLFISDREKLSSFKSNYIFNGVFSLNLLDTPRITKEEPKDELVWAVQTGPLIKENNQYFSYSSETDKAARRMLATVTGDNEVIFLTIYNPNSFFDGPKLSQLAGLIEKFENQTEILFADIINLDGGSASAFYGVNTTLKEISPVGSLFCVK